MSQPDEIANMSMGNTKKELLEAYDHLKKKLKSHQKDLLDAENTRKQMEKKLNQAEAESQSSQDPVQRLHELRADIGGELLKLADKFENELDTFNKIQAAVKSRQQDLKTIYGVESAASDLAALIEAQNVKKAKFDEHMAAQQADFELEMNEIRAQWNVESTHREQALKEEAETIKKERQREKEEFEYIFSREKAQLKNKLKDEIEALEKEINQKRSAFEEEYQKRSAELEARENTISAKDEELTTLRARVEAFPKELEDKIKSTVTSVSERLTTDFKKAEALAEAKHEGEKNVLLSKLESFEKMVVSYQAQIAELSRRHEQAYEKVQDIANRAVASAKREFITAPVAISDKKE